MGCLSGCHCCFVPQIHWGGSAEFSRLSAKWGMGKLAQILETSVNARMFKRLCLNLMAKWPPKEERERMSPDHTASWAVIATDERLICISVFQRVTKDSPV